MTRARETAPSAIAAGVRCQACERSLAHVREVGWECGCGVVVCAQDECTSEYFRFVAGGEATRCLSCDAIL
jgi:hypothetical protein